MVTIMDKSLCNICVKNPGSLRCSKKSFIIILYYNSKEQGDYKGRELGLGDNVDGFCNRENR